MLDTASSPLPTLAFEMPPGPFSVVLADPPWLFASNSEEKPGKNPRGHYPCQPTEAIAAMPVGEVAGPDAMLYLWATSPMLPEALAVMAAWGFTYKSQIVWDKERIGVGFHVRNQHELLLIGRRGRGPLMAHRTSVPSVIREKARQHSRKPEASYAMLEEGYPGLPKLELFGRAQRGPDWTVWGNDTGKFDDELTQATASARVISIAKPAPPVDLIAFLDFAYPLAICGAMTAGEIVNAWAHEMRSKEAA